MSFDKSRLPDPLTFYEAEGLTLRGHGPWRTTRCVFHEDETPSLRIKVENGAFVCFGCGERGGNVLAYVMLARGIGFIEACRELGAWIDDGKPGRVPIKRPELSCQDRLEVLYRESLIMFVTGSDIGQGCTISDVDRDRFQLALSRINLVAWKGGE